MATVVELSAPYENHLRPVLRSGPGICDVCHTYVVGGYSSCWRCNSDRQRLTATAGAVGFVALAVKHEQLARELAVYKGARADARRFPQIGLAAILWRWLNSHETCLANAVGVDSFPIVTTVPSTSGRTTHPLIEIVDTLVGPTRDRYRPLLQTHVPGDNDREARDDRFDISSQLLRDQPVLLIDDTWTTGGHAQSGASALRLAGAGPIAIVAIGRHFVTEVREDYADAARAYYQRSKTLDWDWSRCCLCDDR